MNEKGKKGTERAHFELDFAFIPLRKGDAISNVPSKGPPGVRKMKCFRSRGQSNAWNLYTAVRIARRRL